MILRLATADDAAAIAVLHRATVRISQPYLPDLHTPAEDLAFFADRLLPANTVWVAEARASLAGYIAFDADWIQHLYVCSDAQGQGIGPRLLDKALTDDRAKRLWTFQQNAIARRFYEARGFVLLELADGSGNAEKTPDALYEWRPAANPAGGL